MDVGSLDGFRKMFTKLVDELDEFKKKEFELRSSLNSVEEARNKAEEEVSSLRAKCFEIERDSKQQMLSERQLNEQRLVSLNENNRFLVNELQIEREKVKILCDERSRLAQAKELLEEEYKRLKTLAIDSETVKNTFHNLQLVFESLKVKQALLLQDHDFIKSEKSRIVTIEQDVLKSFQRLKDENARLKEAIKSKAVETEMKKHFQTRLDEKEAENRILKNSLSAREKELADLDKITQAESSRYDTLLSYLEDSVRDKIKSSLEVIDGKESTGSDCLSNNESTK
ncbi:hypothetical protein HDE_07508 [Halotydeus destructor]|nr:hypothetical protein HDE_07508 [Halotydeus destructor]